MKKGSKILIYLVVSIVFIYFLVISIVPKIVDKQHNQIRTKPPYVVSAEIQELYNNLSFIADMHCDALLWKRDLLKDNDFGQVDIPKMIKANIGLQAFTIVTKSPKDQNFEQEPLLFLSQYGTSYHFKKLDELARQGRTADRVRSPFRVRSAADIRRPGGRRAPGSARPAPTPSRTSPRPVRGAVRGHTPDPRPRAGRHRWDVA